MRKVLTGLVVLFVCSWASPPSKADGNAPSAAAPSLEEACKTVYTDCRVDHTVQLRLADGSEYKKTIALSYPPVKNGTFVTIFPGESLRLEATLEGDRITALKTASPTADPARTIGIELKQTDGKADMTLIVTNPFPHVLKYRAGIQVRADDDLRKTSSCGVMAGISGIESWRYPVYEVAMTDFRLLPDDNLVCE